MITGEQFLNWCKDNFWSLLLGLSIFIQITPIKLNPWSRLFKWIGTVINSDVKKDIKELNKTTQELKSVTESLEKNVMENEKDRIRWEILDFANSCRNNVRHTKDEFQHIVDLNDKYTDLLIKTEDKNGVFEAEYEYIKKIYKERQEKNDFL